MHKMEPEYEELQTAMDKRWNEIPSSAKKILFGERPEKSEVFETWKVDFSIQFWHDKYFALKDSLKKKENNP